MNGVQTRFKCKLDVKRCKRFVFPPSSLLPRSNALKTKAIRYFQTDRTLTRIVSPPLAAGPPLNPVEMACESFDQIISKLTEDKNFVVAFNEVYPDGLNEKNITNAIQEFEKTLLTPNSRFDRYLKGQKDAITADEIAGYDLFKKYDCATCHVGEILGGQSYELIGVQHDYFADRQAEMTEEDNGRFKQTKAERDRHRFKVPGLRNIELTAPYFHDGSMATMDDAVRAMAKYQLGIDLPQPEVDKIVAFLRTLTGEYKGKLLTNKNMI